ncbi:extensin family protein [Aureimonas phyllosphaerae]|nr:extensin family protein [Aureimonas phyllosphaerae]
MKRGPRMADRLIFQLAMLGFLAAAPAAAQTVPVPTEAPGERPAAADVAPGAPSNPASEAATPDPASVPVPEERPAPPEAPAAAAAAPADAAPAAPAEPEAPPTAPPAPARDAPQPAYVSPEKARTEPEPGAPDVPPMAVTPAETVEAAAAVEDAIQCEGELKARGADFTVGETIAEGDCGVLRPVSVKTLSNGTSVEPGTVMLCRTALALDVWVSEGVAPAAKAEFKGAKVKALTQASTYVCRARASEQKISEHSRGSAIDIAGFELSDGTTQPVEAKEAGTPADRFAAAVRRAACGPFRTVLGPGTDSDHGTHLHLDIAARNGDATYCR